MINAIVLIKSGKQALATLGEKLVEVPGVAEAYTVTGEYDFVAILRVERYEELSDLVTAKLARIEGIEKTYTMVAFQCYSRYDLARMWSLGL